MENDGRITTFFISDSFNIYGAYAVKVAAFGYEDKMDPDIFGKGKNYWNSPFSNSSMLLKLSNGAIIRISENRRIAWNTPETYITSFNGTKASYECSLMQHSYLIMDESGKVEYEDVSDLLNPEELTRHKKDPDYLKQAVNGEWGTTEAPIQACMRLPKEFDNLPTGHAGTHKFMVDDFCQAYVSGNLAPTNAWQAARYNIPGLVAHQCIMEGANTADIPDLGEPPIGLKVFSADREKNEIAY